MPAVTLAVRLGRFNCLFLSRKKSSRKTTFQRMEEPIWDVQELEFELHIDRQLRLLATHMDLDYDVEETLEDIRGLALEYCDELAQESGMYIGINDVLTFLLNDPFEVMIVVDMQQVSLGLLWILQLTFSQ